MHGFTLVKQGHKFTLFDATYCLSVCLFISDKGFLVECGPCNTPVNLTNIVFFEIMFHYHFYDIVDVAVATTSSKKVYLVELGQPALCFIPHTKQLTLSSY